MRHARAEQLGCSDAAPRRSVTCRRLRQDRCTSCRSTIAAPFETQDVRLERAAHGRADRRDRGSDRRDLRRLQAAAIAGGVPKAKAGILVDEQFGAAILRDATARASPRPCPGARKVDRRNSISSTATISPRTSRRSHPAFCKVLVALQPGGRRGAQSTAQAERLKRLSDYLAHEGTGVASCSSCWCPRRAPSAARRDVNGDQTGLRPRRCAPIVDGAGVRSELQDAGVEPDVWKIEGLDRREDLRERSCAVAPARRPCEGRAASSSGRGEDDVKVHEWLATAAGVPGFIGFAVGRTDFWDPLVQWRANQVTRAGPRAQRRWRAATGSSTVSRTAAVAKSGRIRGAGRGSAIFEAGHAQCRRLIAATRTLCSARKEHVMQLGMIGLGRMGANMVRRLMQGRPQCVVFDMSPKAVAELAKEKAVGATSLADFVGKLAKPRARVADGAGGGRRQDRSPICCRTWSRATS